ncbi:MAG: hypothetical protein KBB77_03070 [Candidatus Moranbacteria bacterium]|nr:hypothetical protein [Candidatus Moranbacteria bacterium]
MGLPQFAEIFLKKVGIENPSKKEGTSQDPIFEFVPIVLDDLKKQGVWKNALGDRLRVNANALTMTSYTGDGQEVYYNSPEDILRILTDGKYVLVPGTFQAVERVVSPDQIREEKIDQEQVDQGRAQQVLARLREVPNEERDLRPKASVIDIVSASRQFPAVRASKKDQREATSGGRMPDSGGDEGGGERLIIDEIIANSASVQQLVESVQGESGKDTTGVIAELLKKLMEDKVLFDSEVAQAKEAGGKNRKKLQEFGQRCATLLDRAIEAQQALEMLLAKNTAGTSEKAFEAVSELLNNPATVEGSINAPVVSSASVTVDTSGSTPEPSTLVVPKSAGETPALQGEGLKDSQEAESAKLAEVLEKWQAEVQALIEGISTPEAYAEFRGGMTNPDKIDKRHFFDFTNIRSEVGIKEKFTPAQLGQIADTERALEDLTRAKFEALVKADLDVQYDREQEKIDGAKNEVELDALVATWVQSPNVVLTWKEVLTKIPKVEQEIVNQEYRGCSEELSENVRQKREFFKQERIAEERRPLTLFLERPIGERCVAKYREILKGERQKFFDALWYEVKRNKKKDLTRDKKIEEWNTFYLPEVRKPIVKHIAKQAGMTEADAEAIFLILLRDLDEEFSEKKKRS